MCLARRNCTASFWWMLRVWNSSSRCAGAPGKEDSSKVRERDTSCRSRHCSSARAVSGSMRRASTGNAAKPAIINCMAHETWLKSSD